MSEIVKEVDIGNSPEIKAFLVEYQDINEDTEELTDGGVEIAEELLEKIL